MNKRDTKIMDRLRSDIQFLEDKGYLVSFAGLYGSQNYNLDDNTSDIDVKAIVALSPEQLLRKQNVSKVYEREGGLLEVKDLMTYVNTAAKGNPAFLEPFHSKYKIGEFALVREMRKFKLNPSAVVGMMFQKIAQMEKGDETFGKNESHVIRLYYLVAQGLNNIFTEHDGPLREELLAIKRGKTSKGLEDSRALVNTIKKKYSNYVYEKDQDAIDNIVSAAVDIYSGDTPDGFIDFHSLDQNLKERGLAYDYFSDKVKVQLEEVVDKRHEIAGFKALSLTAMEFFVILSIVLNMSIWLGLKPLFAVIINTLTIGVHLGRKIKDAIKQNKR